MTFSTSVYPDKLIIYTHQGQQHHGEEAFVVVEPTAGVVWFLDGYVLAIQSPQGMRNIAAILELLYWEMAFQSSCVLGSDMTSPFSSCMMA